MHTFVFSSNVLKYKNNKIYILSNECDFIEKNYEENTYFLNLDDIQKQGVINCNNQLINYDLLSFSEDKNISIKMNFDTNIDNTEELIKLMHITDLYLSGINDIQDISINDSILKKYSNSYFKI